MEEVQVNELSNPSTTRHAGKIIVINKNGYGFISCPDKPFTRIFFHWSGLNTNTLHFTELRRQMKVEFNLINYENRGWRAIHIDVIPNDV